jgi:DNA gyrase/topoisomerase IV subunit A
MNLTQEQPLTAMNVQPAILHEEIETRYLSYALSTIVSRALPDVRDGLKPVHRRILFAMHSIGAAAAARFVKSARVVGEVIGKYHPHGDVAVYDAMVRMAQDFALRYPVVEGQGNFGSLDGDNAAAMRYTEARTSTIAEEFFHDLQLNTVSFQSNYDATLQEPAVLPVRFPNLLVNGSSGIAVGMSTSFPPHNMTEVCDALLACIERQDIKTQELMQLIKAPDFPTGGEILNDFQELVEIYRQGRGVHSGTRPVPGGNPETRAPAFGPHLYPLFGEQGAPHRKNRAIHPNSKAPSGQQHLGRKHRRRAHRTGTQSGAG